MQTLITVIHVFTCVLLVLVVLIQSGKGAEISSSFGGSSQTIFGSSGGANFFTRLTSSLAVIFMVTSVVLTLLGGQSRRSLFDLQPPVNTSGEPVEAIQPDASPSAATAADASVPQTTGGAK